MSTKKQERESISYIFDSNGQKSTYWCKHCGFNTNLHNSMVQHTLKSETECIPPYYLDSKYDAEQVFNKAAINKYLANVATL